jgi:plasmid stabilization system protein ParE
MIDVEIAAAASADLEDILRFSIVRFGEERASRYFDDIENAIRRLREFPDSGVLYPGTLPPVRYASCGSHRIFYTRRDGRLLVIRVLHQAMRAEGRIS